MAVAHGSPSSAKLTPQQRRRLAECFERGRHLAAVEKDHDYAHAMFAECVGQDPASLEYVEALLANLKAKFGGDKKNAAHLFRLRGEREFKKAAAEKDWPQVLRLGIGVLEGDPWHVATLRGMARACEALHYNEVELAYLKQALDAAPKDAEVNRHCARSLARMGQFDQAMACWHRVEEITGGDRQAAEMISRLAEERMRAKPEGKDEERKSSRAAEQQSEEEEESSRATEAQEVQRHGPVGIVLSSRQKLERAIDDDPADVGNYLKLAELMSEMGHYENAQRTLAKAQENCAQVQLVRDALERVQTLRTSAEREAAEIERQKELRAQQQGFRMPWLELALAAAGLVLVFQFFPSWWQAVSGAAIEHARVLLIGANVVALTALIVWRQREKGSKQ